MHRIVQSGRWGRSQPVLPADLVVPVAADAVVVPHR
jgi:hypothetical protein